MKQTFKMVEASGYYTRFTLQPNGSVEIEEFDPRDKSLGWARVTTIERARELYRKCLKDWGMKPCV